MTATLGSPHSDRHRARQNGSRVAMLVVVVVAFSITATLVLHDVRVTETRARDLRIPQLLLAAATSLPLIWWRRSPLTVFVIAAAASAPLLRYQPMPPLGATVALYLLAASRNVRHPWTVRTTAAAMALFAAHVVAVGLAYDQSFVVPLLISTLGWTAAWFAGDRTRIRREYVAVLEERAARAEEAVERDRRLTIVEERMRIARDLHDSAGHAINVILVQAGAARLLQDRDDVATRTAITTIEDVARQTLDDIDRLVGGLRDGAADGEVAKEVEGPTGLAALAALITRHRAIGLEISIDSIAAIEAASSTGLVPAPVGQATYRIVQEALTNAARHGTGAAHVTIEFTDTHVDLTVTNPVAAQTDEPIRRGHGIIGIQERAALLGGVAAISEDDGAFTVRARLPLRWGTP